MPIESSKRCIRTLSYVLGLLAALVGTAAASPSTVTAAQVADPVPGWRLVSTQDFAGSRLGSQWGAYGGTYSIGANAWSPDEVSTSGGTLHVRMERRTTAGKPYTSGGAAMWGFTQTYGRYEFTAKAPSTPGIDSYVTLWPPDSDSDGDALLIELLAKPAVAPGQEAAYVTSAAGGKKQFATVAGHYTDAFHDYVVEWTPTYESVSVDGRVLLKSARSASVRRWIGFIMSNGDTLTGTPSASAQLPAEFLVQNLRIYAYAPGGAAVPTSSQSATRSATQSATPSGAPGATRSVSGPSAGHTSAAGATALTSSAGFGSAGASGSVSGAGTGAGAPAASSSGDTAALAAARGGGASTSTILVVGGVVALVAAACAVVLRRPSGRRRLR